MVSGAANGQNVGMKTTMTFAQAREAAAKLNGRVDRKGSTSGGFFVQFMGFLCCLVLPAFWTAIAPVSFTTLTREGGKVRLRGKTCSSSFRTALASWRMSRTWTTDFARVRSVTAA